MKHRITKKILEKLVQLRLSLCIMTKPDLVIRDVDLFKQFDNKCIIAVPVPTRDDKR